MSSSAIEPLGGDLTTVNYFLVQLDGEEIGVFREITGLQVEVAFQEIVEGGQNEYVHRVPGRMTWPNLVLKRGLTNSNVLFEWLTEMSGERFAARGNKVEPATAAVVALNRAGDKLRSWNLHRAYPVRWTGPNFSSDGSGHLEEELEIAHHGFTVETHKVNP